MNSTSHALSMSTSVTSLIVLCMQDVHVSEPLLMVAFRMRTSSLKVHFLHLVMAPATHLKHNDLNSHTVRGHLSRTDYDIWIPRIPNPTDSKYENFSSTVIGIHPRNGIHDLLPDKSIQLNDELTTQDTTIFQRPRGNGTELRNVNHMHSKLQIVLTINGGQRHDLFVLDIGGVDQSHRRQFV